MEKSHLHIGRLCQTAIIYGPTGGRCAKQEHFNANFMYMREIISQHAEIQHIFIFRPIANLLPKTRELFCKEDIRLIREWSCVKHIKRIDSVSVLGNFYWQKSRCCIKTKNTLKFYYAHNRKLLITIHRTFVVKLWKPKLFNQMRQNRKILYCYSCHARGVPLKRAYLKLTTRNKTISNIVNKFPTTRLHENCSLVKLLGRPCRSWWICWELTSLSQ